MKMIAFDLDGTLLNSRKNITQATKQILKEISESGVLVAFASGRLCSSMLKYAAGIKQKIPLITLNGAEVFIGSENGLQQLYKITLPQKYADYLIQYAKGKGFAVNYYLDGRLYAEKNEKVRQWIDLYVQQTGTDYNFLSSLGFLKGNFPSKVIFVGNSKEIDFQEKEFRSKWNHSVYICRTWKHYLEFLNIKADKGFGLDQLAKAYDIDLKDVIVFGDAQNDIPMFRKAGYSIAVKNASEEVKSAADKVSQWSNDEDFLVHEWNILKKSI